MSLMVTFSFMLNISIPGKREWNSNVQCIVGSFLIWRALHLHLAESGHLWQFFNFNFYIYRTLVKMCKTSSTPIVNKGSGPTDNTIVNDQSTSLINFHEKYPIATMMLFGLLVLIVYFNSTCDNDSHGSYASTFNPVPSTAAPQSTAAVPPSAAHQLPMGVSAATN